jgi:aryl carrier-like protein
VTPDQQPTGSSTPVDITTTVTDAVRRYLPAVGTSEDLFETGLTSILAMDLLETLSAELAVPMSLRALLEQPTISGLVAAVHVARHRQ